MALLINMEVINIIQMLEACEVCAASMTEAFQRDGALDSLLGGGDWKCKPWPGPLLLL